MNHTRGSVDHSHYFPRVQTAHTDLLLITIYSFFLPTPLHLLPCDQPTQHCLGFVAASQRHTVPLVPVIGHGGMMQIVPNFLYDFVGSVCVVI